MATKAKKVSELPEASTIDGFYAFGTDKDNKSVKVPIEMLKGNEGKTPHVGSNGNWFVGDIDLGVHAQGEPGKDGKDGEVTLVQLGVKADKSLTDSSPVTYFKSGEGGSSEIDLTAELRASIVPFVWGGEKNWMMSDQQRNGQNLMLQPSTLEGQGDKRSMIKYKLKANTWYKLAGLNSPLSYYCFEVPVDDHGLTATGQPRQMLPVATLTRDGDSNNNMRAATVEWMYADFGKPIIFKTRTKVGNTEAALWLTVMVKLDDTIVMNRNATALDYYHYPDWAFDSRSTVTLHELPNYDGSENSNTEPVDRLVDSLGKLLKEFNFDSIVNNKLNEIKGIIAGGGSISNPNLMPASPKVIGGYQLTYDNVGIKTSNSQYSYIDDYIPVLPNTSYRGLGSAANSTESGTGKEDLRLVIFYDKDKNVLPNTIDPAYSRYFATGQEQGRVFITPSNCYFIRINIQTYYFSGGGSGNQRKAINRNFDSYVEEEPRVSLNISDLEDAQPVTVNSESGIFFPKLYIPQTNIIGSNPEPSAFTINMRNMTTFVGSFNTAIDRIVDLQPKARHIFVGHFTYDSAIGNGWLRPMIETQRAMCENRSIPYIDLASIMGWTYSDDNVIDGVDYNNLIKFIPDRIHPGKDTTQVAANLLTDRLTILLRTFVKSGEIVANIGDSVSAGYTGTPIGVASWARYIERALIAIGCTVKLYASSGGSLRAKTTDGGAVNNGFMADTDPAWGFTKDVINNIGTANQPNVYLWEIGHNDFTADDRDFKLNW